MHVYHFRLPQAERCNDCSAVAATLAIVTMEQLHFWPAHTGRNGEWGWLTKEDLFHISVTHATRFRFVTPTSTFGPSSSPSPFPFPFPARLPIWSCQCGQLHFKRGTSIGLDAGRRTQDERTKDKGRVAGAFGCQTPGEGFSMSFDTRSIAISVQGSAYSVLVINFGL